MAEFQYLDEGNSEAQDRLATSYLLAQTSPGLARTGVLSGLTVTQTATASGSVLVASGAAAVQASVGTGVALLVNDTQATLDVFTTEPMGGLPRNDVVAFDSVTKALIFIKGEPNAAPTDPTVPDTACALYRLRHAASATTIPTAKIDDLRTFTALAGDVWSRLDTTTASGPVRRQWGIARLTAPGGTPRATPLAVTFPVAFSGVPHVTAAIMGFRTSGAYNPVGLTTATADLWLATATGRSTTAMTLNLYESSSGTITAGYDLYVSWEAVGPA